MGGGGRKKWSIRGVRRWFGGSKWQWSKTREKKVRKLRGEGWKSDVIGKASRRWFRMSDHRNRVHRAKCERCEVLPLSLPPPPLLAGITQTVLRDISSPPPLHPLAFHVLVSARFAEEKLPFTGTLHSTSFALFYVVYPGPHFFELPLAFSKLCRPH